MSQITVQRGSPTQDETVAQKRRTTHFMPRRKQEHIYGRVGATIDRYTWFENEGSCGGVHRKEIGATYFQGSVPIDAIWAISDVTVSNACVMPVGYGVGDHCLFVVDFATTLLVGTGCMQKIIRPALHCLNTRIKGCTQWYDKALKRNILRHRLLE